MAGKMKTVHAPRREDDALVVVVDPLWAARGPRLLKRGGVHQTARKPSRAKAKRQMRRELAEGSASCRERVR
jgi:hypothetical protein